MEKGIMNCEIKIKTSPAGIEISMEGSLPSMECGIYECIKKLAEHQGVSFSEYLDNMKRVHEEVQELKNNPMKLIEKIFESMLNDEPDIDEVLKAMMKGGN